MTYKKSPLKYAGAKSWMLPHLLPLIPESCTRVVEPFAGSAVFSLNVKQPTLTCDINPDIIEVFLNLKSDNVQARGAFMKWCTQYFKPEFNTAEQYYEMRTFFNDHAHSAFQRAAAFIYLNRHGFNGLCRYNQSGGFNVPFGKYTNPKCPLEAMREFSKESARMTFKAQSFEHTLDEVREGDFTYCDPPYTPISKTSSFTGYHTGGFSQDQQERLATRAQMIRHTIPNVTTVISNNATEKMIEIYRDIYQADELLIVPARRRISCKVETRGDVNEVMAIWRS